MQRMFGRSRAHTSLRLFSRMGFAIRRNFSACPNYENEFTQVTWEKIESEPFRHVESLIRHYAAEKSEDLPFHSPVSISQMNALTQTVSERNQLLRDIKFLEQDELMQTVDKTALDEAFWYERHIHKTRQVPTRYNNLHDFFGHLIWVTFPKTKTLFNKMHIENMMNPSSRDVKQRSTVQNFLTLFDECGVIVFIEEEQYDTLSNMLMDMKFKELFWNNRDLLTRHVNFVIFGHSILEMLSMRPYIGYTTKCMTIPITSDKSKLVEKCF